MSRYQHDFSDTHEQVDHGTDNKMVHQIESSQIRFNDPDGAISGNVTFDSETGKFVVEGRSKSSGSVIRYWAANPLHRGYSYSGSALPYPNPEIAYEGTPNSGEVLIDDDGGFKIMLDYPSSYYVRQGTILLKPHVHLALPNSPKVFTVDLGEPFPYRSLTGLLGRPQRSTGR